MMTSSEWLRGEAPSLHLTGLAEHTAEIESGYGFVCVTKDPTQRIRYVAQAESSGAAAILTDAEFAPIKTELPVFALEHLVEQRGELAANFYEHPSASVRCIGITGTNGKTSVAYHIADLLNQMGCKTGYMGTLGWGLLDDLRDPDLTTGNPVALQRRLATLKEVGCKVVAIEISSHALEQGRAHDVQIELAIFTNLSRDHLDYHKTMNEYAAAKARLFVDFPLNVAVLNTDDSFVDKVQIPDGIKVIGYGADGDWSWETDDLDGRLQRVTWRTPMGALTADLNVPAEYVLQNVTAALIAVTEMGSNLESCADALVRLSHVPGRMEVVDMGPDNPSVVVDFAHTPDALDKVLAACRDKYSGRLICVVGCGGDRDQGKRPEMARVSAKHADDLWFTSDNPRTEPPAVIIEDMLAGLPKNCNVNTVTDRREAITRAVQSAAVGDIVLIAGKGHETYQEIEGVRHPFSDRTVAQSVLRER
ncbi:MAG: UDP-N-acetylmuramoyl-L-alanyl-D-glutamate--2,6-diaminopimelate ligase [Pseudomonadales bacterium]|nr:UDP-N-acetylmuramoyl-L-alanyl-D-glutamate--2,6-diaminopimelate ligase [Pseudomonadales bacterium]